MHYTLEYPPPVGRQEYEFRLTAPDAFRDEIAPARTFGFVKEIETLEQMGLANGGRLNNCILVGDEGVVNAPLRFPDEFVRHKILDIMGDFYLLGRPDPRPHRRTAARGTRTTRRCSACCASASAYRRCAASSGAAHGSSCRQPVTRGSLPDGHTIASTRRRTRPTPTVARTR